MSKTPTPLCPMGHEIDLIQVAAGGWRYVCTRCATSFKVKKSTSCGWLSPIKSTKERAYEAATKRPLQKPLTLEEAVTLRGVWIEDSYCDYGDEVFPAIYQCLGHPHSSVFIADIDDGKEKAWFNNDYYGID